MLEICDYCLSDSFEICLFPLTCLECKLERSVCRVCLQDRKKHCKICKVAIIEKKLNESQSLAFLPIQNPAIDALYQKLKRTRWTTSEIDFADDRNSWSVQDEDTKRYVKFLLFLFAQLDGLVIENLVENFKKETVKLAKECKAFYAEQESNETTHNETYSFLIKAFISDEVEQSEGLNSINHYPAIRKIAKWSYEWMDRDLPLTKRAIAFCCIEGIIFSSAFAGIYWIKRKNRLLGLCKANEWIARDEGVHTEFGVCLYHHMTAIWKKFASLTTEEVHSIIKSAVAVTEEFTLDAMNCHLVGLDANAMMEYVKCTADVLAVSLGYPVIYGVKNPFEWMKILSVANKTNFFESKVTEYSTAAASDKKWDEDF